MNPKSLVAVICLAGLFSSAVRNCPLGSIADSRNDFSCCAEPEEKSCPVSHSQEGKNSNNNLLCCDQPRVATNPDVYGFKLPDLNHLYTVTLSNDPINVSTRAKIHAAISLIGPPQTSIDAFAIRAPPILA